MSLLFCHFWIQNRFLTRSVQNQLDRRGKLSYWSTIDNSTFLSEPQSGDCDSSWEPTVSLTEWLEHIPTVYLLFLSLSSQVVNTIPSCPVGGKPTTMTRKRSIVKVRIAGAHSFVQSWVDEILIGGVGGVSLGRALASTSYQEERLETSVCKYFLQLSLLLGLKTVDSLQFIFKQFQINNKNVIKSNLEKFIFFYFFILETWIYGTLQFQKKRCIRQW